jgi:hypothetical protein
MFGSAIAQSGQEAANHARRHVDDQWLCFVEAHQQSEPSTESAGLFTENDGR